MAPPPRSLLISRTAHETRVAHVDGAGRVVDLAVERSGTPALTGNVYLGRIRRLVPGMEAAFVDIGAERAAYLPLSEADALDRTPLEKGARRIVQVGRDAFGGKGARLTTRVSIPGRHLILTATTERVHLSKRISDPDARERLAALGESLRADGCGWIVRTAAADAAEDEIAADAKHLLGTWGRMRERARTGSPPEALWTDPGLALREIRDHLGITADVALIDGAADEVASIVERAAAIGIPRPDTTIQGTAPGEAPLFQRLGIERVIAGALAREVRLACGGSIAIDATEAATFVDVNTGRHVGHRDLERTIVETNVEAAAAVAVQTRLRSVAGLIVVDFIDMREGRNRERVLEALRDGFRDDPAPIRIGDFTQMGLVEITRGRSRPSLAEVLLDTCPTCDGSGQVPRR